MDFNIGLSPIQVLMVKTKQPLKLKLLQLFGLCSWQHGSGSEMVLGRMYNKCLGEKFGFLSKFSDENEPVNLKEFKHKGKTMVN